jgi:Domain of unknown function (DUF1707)/Cell wall-active antibiotics response 4TMS YvqF
MTSPNLPLAIGTARERTIERLSTHFANDRLTIDELDARLEQAYAATSLAELDALTADLPGARLPAVDETDPTASTSIERYEGPATIRAILSETRRGGLWVVPPQLDLKAVMANITLDLRSAMLSPGITDVDVKAIMASVNILLPPGVRVIENLRAFMASVTDDTYSDVSNPSAPVIRLTGRAFMSEVKVRTKSHRTVE